MLLTTTKRYMQKLLLFITTILILIIPVFAANIDLINSTSDFYVNDTANILSADVKQHIINTNKKFENTKEKPQIVVATIPTLDGSSVEEYAVKLFEKFGIGNQSLDNGVLVLLSKEDRKIRIEVGYGLEGALPDSVAGAILDNNLDQLKQDNFSEAIHGIFNDLVSKVADEYDYSSDIFQRTELKYTNQNTNQNEFSFSRMLLLIVIGILVVLDIIFNRGRLTRILIHILSLLGSGSGRGSGGGRSGGGGGRSGGGGASRSF